MAKNQTANAAEKVKIDVNTVETINFGQSFGEDVESKIKWKPRAELGNRGLGKLVAVELIEKPQSETDENGVRSTWEYAGLTVPSLKLTFEEVPTPEDPVERFYEHYFTVFTNVKKDGTAIDRSTILDHYTREYKQLRHIANAFKTNANYDPTLKDADLKPFIENPAERLASLKSYFESWVKIFGGKDGKGFPQQINWLIVIASSTGTYYTLPSYVGQGFIEKYVEGRQPAIEVPINQTVVLKAKERTSAGASSASGKTATVAASGADAIPADVANLVSKFRGA